MSDPAHVWPPGHWMWRQFPWALCYYREWNDGRCCRVRFVADCCRHSDATLPRSCSVVADTLRCSWCTVNMTQWSYLSCLHVHHGKKHFDCIMCSIWRQCISMRAVECWENMWLMIHAVSSKDYLLKCYNIHTDSALFVCLLFHFAFCASWCSSFI